jgi:hypothetical protein
MLPTLILTLTLAPGVDVFGGAKADPLGPKAYPPARHLRHLHPRPHLHHSLHYLDHQFHHSFSNRPMALRGRGCHGFYCL